MRRIGVLVGVVAVSVLGGGEASGQDLRPRFENSILRLEVDYWRPELTAQLRAGAEGTLIDVKTDLGVPDNDTFRIAAVLRFTDRHRVRASYTGLKYEGQQRIQRTIVFEGKTYDVDTEVFSSLDGGYFTADYRFGLVRTRGFDLDGLVGAKYADVDALILSPDVGQRALASLQAPIPVAGVVARVHAGPVGLSGEFSGLTIGKRGSLYELDIRGRAFVSRYAAAHLGYRRLHVRADDEPDFGLFKPGGFYFGAEVGF